MSGERPPSGPAGYERTREEILRKYQELGAARRQLAVQETRFEQVCQRVPPEYRPDPSWSIRLKQIMGQMLEKIEGLLSDIAFPVFAFEDSLRWTDISHAATLASNKTVRIRSHANDPDTWRTGVPQNLVAGREFAGRGDPQFPWDGITGKNYRSQIPGQQRAADRLALIANRTASATNSAAVNTLFLYLAILTLIIACILAIKFIAALLVGLANALVWIAGALVGGVAFAIGMRIAMQFLRTAYKALLDLVEKIWAALITWMATLLAVEWAVRQQIVLIENTLAEDAPNESAAFPNGKWPNPTTHDAFPHMERGPDGRWRVYTQREFPH